MNQQDHLNLLAFDTAPIGLVLTQNRIIMACNTAFCDLSGYPKGDLIGQSFRLLYDSDDEFDRFRDIGAEALLSHGSYSDQRLLRRRDGRAVWCRFRAQAHDRANPLAGAVLSYAELGDAANRPTLTARERDIVLLLSRGLTSAQIGEELDLSPRSVEDVRARLLKKFGVRNAAEMLASLTNIEG